MIICAWSFLPQTIGDFLTLGQLYEVFEYFGKYFRFGMNVKDSPIEFNFEIQGH